MAIRQISIHRDWSSANVNPEFHKEDGTVIPFWSITNETLRARYYVHPEVCAWTLLSLAKENKPLPPGYIQEKNETTYVGRVMSVQTREERVMSDVWENVTRAVVYSPETVGQKIWSYSEDVQTSPYISVPVHTTGNYLTWGHAEVDCDPEIIARWEKELKEERERKEKERQEYEALQRRKSVEMGKIVRVNRGRKVPQGTTGKVFWIGNDGYRAKIGIATSPKRDKIQGKNGRTYDGFVHTVFVATDNVDVVGSESLEAMNEALKTWENQP